eukprot:364287-Chlamydomonas_euryale.AAC.18
MLEGGAKPGMWGDEGREAARQGRRAEGEGGRGFLQTTPHPEPYTPAPNHTQNYTPTPRTSAPQPHLQHELLVRLLEARDPRVSSSLPGVAAILVRVLGGGTRLCSADVGKRGAALLAEMLSMPVPADAIATAGAAMTPKQQAALQAYMAGGVPDDA